MNLETQRRYVRTAFLTLAIGGVLLNIFFDALAFSENKTSDQYGHAVVRSYEIQTSLTQSLALLAHPLSQADRQSLDTLLAAAEKNADDAAVVNGLRELRRETDAKRAAELARSLVEINGTSLRSRLAADVAQDQSVETSMLRALVLDGAFMLVLIALFFFDLRIRRRAEENLKESICLLRETQLGLEEENMRQRMMMKTAAHDLRNPIGSIVGFAEILEDYADSKTSVLEFSERIKKISQRSLSLVETLLAQETAKDLDRRPVDFTDLTREICSQMEILARAKSQTILRELPPNASLSVNGNAVKLDELLANLIGNAIKYSPIGETITVRCYEKHGHAVFEVEDRGPGFAPEDKARAFQYGQKLSARPTNGETSTGYGLYIAKQIAEAHRGQIRLEDSSSGRGARVIVELPLRSGVMAPQPMV